MTRNRDGFTFIELLVVVVIIGILASIALPRFSATKDKARLAATRADLHNLETAEESYYTDNAKYADLGHLLSDGLLKLSPGDAVTVTITTTGYSVHAINSTIMSGINTCSVQVGAGITTATDAGITCP